MPEHKISDAEGSSIPSFLKDNICKGSKETGWVLMQPDGTLHCNNCGWVTPEPVITAYSSDTDRTYLTWDELVHAESNGYVVVGTVSRPNTVPAVYGPWEASPAGKEEARKAQARLRNRWKREERLNHGPGVKVTVLVRVLWEDPTRR